MMVWLNTCSTVDAAPNHLSISPSIFTSLVNKTLRYLNSYLNGLTLHPPPVSHLRRSRKQFVTDWFSSPSDWQRPPSSATRERNYEAAASTCRHNVSFTKNWTQSSVMLVEEGGEPRLTGLCVCCVFSFTQRQNGFQIRGGSLLSDLPRHL